MGRAYPRAGGAAIAYPDASGRGRMMRSDKEAGGEESPAHSDFQVG